MELTRDILIVDDDKQVREVLHQIFLTAGQHLLNLHALKIRLGVVFLRVRDDRVVTFLHVVGALQTDQHTAGLGFMQDFRRNDLQHDGKAHRRRQLRSLGARRRDTFLRHRNAVGVAHQLAFRRRERGPALGFHLVENFFDCCFVVRHFFSLNVLDRAFGAQRGNLILRVTELHEDLFRVFA